MLESNSSAVCFVNNWSNYEGTAKYCDEPAVAQSWIRFRYLLPNQTVFDDRNYSMECSDSFNPTPELEWLIGINSPHARFLYQSNITYFCTDDIFFGDNFLRGQMVKVDYKIPEQDKSRN